MKHEKATQKPAPKRKSSKTAANPVASTVYAALLQNDADVSPDFAENYSSKTQQPCGFPASFHRDPSLPMSVKRPATRRSGME